MPPAENSGLLCELTTSRSQGEYALLKCDIDSHEGRKFCTNCGTPLVATFHSAVHPSSRTKTSAEDVATPSAQRPYCSAQHPAKYPFD
jgi:hypothetical protein